MGLFEAEGERVPAGSPGCYGAKGFGHKPLGLDPQYLIKVSALLTFHFIFSRVTEMKLGYNL